MEHDVALVDDHHLVRAGLVATVNGLGGYRVALEAAHGRELVEQLEHRRNDRLADPTIAIVDLNMPVMDGYATITWLRTHAPDILPLALTFDAADSAVLRAVHAGARGFLLKSARPQVLKAALDSLLLTGYYYSGEVQDARIRELEEKHNEVRERDGVLDRITPREREFLSFVCDEAELTYEQIADRMGVQRRTVDNFRLALFEKFDIKSKTGLVLFALRWKLIPTTRP